MLHGLHSLREYHCKLPLDNEANRSRDTFAVLRVSSSFARVAILVETNTKRTAPDVYKETNHYAEESAAASHNV